MSAADVILFCDFLDADATQSLVASGSGKYSVIVIPLQNGPSLANSVRTAVCSRRAGGNLCCVNWCSGDDESEGRADAAKVAHLLEVVYKVPLIGNPEAVARYDLEDIRALMFYSDLQCSNFCFVKEKKDLHRLSGMACPACVLVGNTSLTAETHDELVAVASTGLLSVPFVLVTESSSTPTHSLTILVRDGCVYNTPTLTPLVGNNEVAMSPSLADAVATFTKTIASTIMGKQGHAEVAVCVDAASSDDSRALTLAGVKFNVALPTRGGGVSLEGYLSVEVPASLAKFDAAAPKHIVSFDPVGKGYFMRASRNIAIGEVVFEDERRAFAIVTREHVAKTWSDEDKYTFSRYAWPLDNDCHVYAIWEDDPKRWRPINHSCDPNLMFAEGHSLNVVARRCVADGEDLTLDYSTFCDYTMKPFTCFCKTDLCRGTVTPGQVPWEQYGTHSWFRREPPQVTELMPSTL